MQLVVLAGGLGTRLRGAIPEDVPKSMATIAGRPFLEHLFDQAIGQGVDAFLLLTGYKAEVISGYFGESFRGVPVAYSVEDVPRGTGGALKAAGPQLASEFLLANGDTFVDVNYRGLLRLLKSSPLCLALASVQDVGRYGSVEIDARSVIGFHEKKFHGRGLINAGVYACSRSLLEILPAQESFPSKATSSRLICPRSGRLSFWRSRLSLISERQNRTP